MQNDYETFSEYYERLGTEQTEEDSEDWYMETKYYQRDEVPLDDVETWWCSRRY